MLRVAVQPEGLEELRRVLAELAEDFSDLDKAGAWQAASEVLSEELETLFKNEGAHGGPKWSRLAPVTVTKRNRLHQTPIRIGWASGRMAQSLISLTHPEAIETREPLEMTRGTRVGSRGFSYPAKFDEKRPIIGRLFGSKETPTVLRLIEAISDRVFKALKK